MTFYKGLSPPQILEEVAFEAILQENQQILLKKMPDWLPHESDPFLMLLESFSYKEVYLRKRINQAIRSLLLPYAKGTDLDYLAVMYGVKRLPGIHPQSSFEFSLSTTLTYDITLPAKLELVSDRQERAFLGENVVIKAGELRGMGKVYLDVFQVMSEVKTEKIVTPLPFVVRARQLGPFINGATQEQDEAFLDRILLSLERFSTAGSEQSYVYHAKSADPRIRDVKVYSPSPGVVEVTYLGAVMDEEMQKNVEKVLWDKKVRPLNEKLIIKPAKIKEITLELDVILKDMLLMEASISSIRQNFEQISLGLQETLFLSWIYKLAHVENVYSVHVRSPVNSVVPERNEAVVIKDILITTEELPKRGDL